MLIQPSGTEESRQPCCTNVWPSPAPEAGPVVIVVHQANTAKQMYVGLGWQPIAMCRQYTNPRT